jgi:hypothetical protein
MSNTSSSVALTTSQNLSNVLAPPGTSINIDALGNAAIINPVTQQPAPYGAFLPTSTFSTLPAVNTVLAGTTYYASDVGVTGGSLWRSDGKQWNLVGGSVNLYQVSFPVGIPPSGTIAANGVLTLGTALDNTYPSIYMWFPAGAWTGSTAGMYYVSMSSTTAGQVYTNQYTGGVPTIPASPTLVTTGVGAYTQTTGAYLTVLSYAMPANVMGSTGSICGKFLASALNNANVKIVAPVSGFTTQNGNVQLSGSGSRQGSATVTNAGSQSRQAVQVAADNTTATAVLILSINTAVSQNVTPQLYLATATDWIILQNYQLTLSR